MVCAALTPMFYAGNVTCWWLWLSSVYTQNRNLIRETFSLNLMQAETVLAMRKSLGSG